MSEADQELWGGETAKAVENFPVSGERVPVSVVRWLAAIKGPRRGSTPTSASSTPTWPSGSAPQPTTSPPVSTTTSSRSMSSRPARARRRT